jgi:hypothetical protein
MRSKRLTSIDRDLLGAQQALERAAAQARRLAEQTGTPFYVLKGGRIGDLNARRSRAKASTRARG